MSKITKSPLRIYLLCALASSSGSVWSANTSASSAVASQSKALPVVIKFACQDQLLKRMQRASLPIALIDSAVLPALAACYAGREVAATEETIKGDLGLIIMKQCYEHVCSIDSTTLPAQKYQAILPYIAPAVLRNGLWLTEAYTNSVVDILLKDTACHQELTASDGLKSEVQRYNEEVAGQCIVVAGECIVFDKAEHEGYPVQDR